MNSCFLRYSYYKRVCKILKSRTIIIENAKPQPGSMLALASFAWEKNCMFISYHLVTN